MNRMLIRPVVAMAISGCAQQQPASGVGSEASNVTITPPQGDARAGRQAFLDLKCTACHAVPTEHKLDFPAPVSASQGPPIDAKLAGRDVSYLMTAIMSPSHEISTGISDELRARLEGALSPMGDFSRAMTVRQLVDLHAFIRSIK